MAYFNIGDTVRNIHTNQKGKVERVYAARRGLQLYGVFYDADNIKDENEDDLERATEIRDLFDRCQIGAYDGYSDFQLFNTTFKIDNSSNNMLSSIKASKTMFKTYQYIPLMKFLSSDLRRLLIADEVGLGKTIEAGHIMLEMKARRELKNVLVVCPKALASKWQSELEERFGLRFTIYSNKEAMKQDIIGHNVQARGIITYEGLSDIRTRRKNKNETKEEKKKREAREANAQKKSVLNFVEQRNIRYSLVVCDEAHHVRNMNTARRESVSRLLKQADAALFLTATPIMLGRENLFSLLNLLNEQRYEYADAFFSELKHAEPVVWAENALNSNVPFVEILQGLEKKIPDDDYIRTLGGFKQVKQLLNGEDNAKQRAIVQSNLYDINPLGSIMSRTRKVDVTEDLSQAVRDTISIKVKLYKHEQEMFDEYEASFEALDSLTVTTRQRQVASSVYGFEYGEEHFIDNLPDAKFDKLIEILNECRKQSTGKMIVFVAFKNTIKYLSKRLSNIGIEFRAISGDDKTREERIQAVDEFRTLPNVHILLSTEVGGEGLDMQFCDTLVNYDLPWNPMVVEQRIGRIDRIGQQSPVIHIYTLMVEGTIQAYIYDRLLTRIEIFRQTIGDLEPILMGAIGDETVEEAIEKLYRTKLTNEEREKQMQNIERAVARNLEDSRRLEKELSDSFTSDSYLRDHLNKIIRRNAYVTEQEVENYVRCLFRDNLPTCSISKLLDNVATITIPQNDAKAVVNFFNRYATLPGESGQVMRDFVNSIRDRNQISITFNQETAEQNRSLMFLNIYHPFVLAAKELFKKGSDRMGGTFRYCLHKADVPIAKHGYYLMGIYNVKTSYQRYGTLRDVFELHAIVYDFQTSELTNQEVVDTLYGKIQSDGIQWDSSDDFKLMDDDTGNIRYVMNGDIADFCNRHREEVTMKQQDDVRQQRQGEEYRFSILIQQLKGIIQDNDEKIAECNRQLFDGNGTEICIWDYEREPEKQRTYEKAKEEFSQVKPAMLGRLRGVEDEYASRSKAFDEIPAPIVDSKLMMLNLIHVI